MAPVSALWLRLCQRFHYKPPCFQGFITQLEKFTLGWNLAQVARFAEISRRMGSRNWCMLWATTLSGDTSAAAVTGHHPVSGTKRQLSRIYLSQHWCQIKQESLRLLQTYQVGSTPWSKCNAEKLNLSTPKPMKLWMWQVFWKGSVSKGQAELALACPLQLWTRVASKQGLQPPLLRVTTDTVPVWGMCNQNLPGWKVQTQTQHLSAFCLL